ncbi:MAG: hypothetical protein K8R89_02530 [Anaerolineae bacterium]|nr:hypothetical protein [Anaerolineae bacterium]
MKFPRLISKKIFQAIALLLLAVCIFLTLYWTFTESGFYVVFRDLLGIRWRWLAAFGTFLVLFVGWVAVVVSIRKLSAMPTLEEEIGASLKDGLPVVLGGLQGVYRQELVKNEPMYRAKEYTPEMKRRARQIGVGFLIAGVIVTLAGVGMIGMTVETGYIFKAQVVMLVLGPALVVTGMIQIITGRAVIRQ